MPPWYASRSAYFLYFLLILGLLGGFILRQQKRFEQKKKHLKLLHQHREEEHIIYARRSEEAINQLQNEILEAEIFHKTQELASVAIHLVQKNSILSPNDDRMCAYLRMNLSSKEITSLMNISLWDVEGSWYRLRRRLDLDTETNLTEYLILF